MNPEVCCSSSCCYSSLQRTVRNRPRLHSIDNIVFFSKTHQSSLTLNDGFFLKSPRPSFFDKAGCTRQIESELSLRSFAQLFPIKEGSTSHLGLLPSGKKSCCSVFSNPSVSLSKGSSTSLSKPLPSQKGEDVPTALLGAQTASL